MMLAVCVLLGVMLQGASCGDYLVQLKSLSGDTEQQEGSAAVDYLADHIALLKANIAEVEVSHVFWTLAEKVGFIGYVISVQTVAPLLDLTPDVKSVEEVGMFHAAAVDFSMPSEYNIDSTLSPFRKNNMASSNVNLDSMFSTEQDSHCVYDAAMYTNMIQPPANMSAVYNMSNPVFSYVLDTGIQSSHEFFHSCVDHGFDFESRRQGEARDSTFQYDPHGHGTQMAGIIRQVCSNTRLIDVRVLGSDGSGRIDNIIRGLEYAVGHYFENFESKGRLHSVINLSFSGHSSNILKNVLYYISKFLLVVGASGDDDTFSCDVSPSNSEFILAAGGATWDSALPLRNSNYGSCVRVRVVSENINAPYIGKSNTSMLPASGSSVAAAYITGVAANIISIIHSTPRAVDVLNRKFPIASKQRRIVEFLIDMISLPAVLGGVSGAHVPHFISCALYNVDSIKATVEQLLHLNMPQATTSAGGRRALQRVKERYKKSQQQLLEERYG